jgi:hypothetical protein
VSYLLDAGLVGLGYYEFKNKTTPHFSAYQGYTIEFVSMAGANV